MSRRILLTGSDLTLEDVAAAASESGACVEIAASAWHAVDRSKAFLYERIDQQIIYGVNTGFGPMVTHIIPRDQVVTLQRNLVRSHAVGMGAPLEEPYVRAAMIVRLNTLARGFSGVSRDLLAKLQTLINHHVTPIVPEHGAVGASGDLIQLAHIALALIGEGDVMHQGRRRSAADTWRDLDIAPHDLQPKEGLALINGTSVMSGIAALLCVEARRVLTFAIRSGALGLELVRSFVDGLSERFHSFRPHRGQLAVAEQLRMILASSMLVRQREDFDRLPPHLAETRSMDDALQEKYSFRCIPQILGPVHDCLEKLCHDVTVEINSVTDNPIVDAEERRFLHGGHFHGDYMASACDQMKAALVKLTLLSERRANFFLHHGVNRRFPPFLNLVRPGLTLALQGLQFVLTSTAAQNQTLAFPHSVHSIPTNADNQDIVSMGTDAVQMAMKVVANAYIVLTCEAVVLAQAVDCLGDRERLSASSRDLYDFVRRSVATIENDRILSDDLARLLATVRQEKGLSSPMTAVSAGS
jgi:histidine ammonia-lyase